MKVVYVIETLASKGGTEKMISQKANYLAEKLGYEVTIITCSQHNYQQNIFSLSVHVQQINLEVPLYSQYQYKYPRRLWIKYKVNKQLQTSLSVIIQALNPNILIGVGHFNADIICSIDTKAKKIIECHEARYFTLSGKSQHQNIISKFFLKIYRFLYFKQIEKKADVVVTLTEGDKLLWNKAKRIEAIPNFSEIPVCQTNYVESKRIIAVGRLSWEKGYDRLLKIWKSIVVKHPDWTLDIYGEGELKAYLSDIINNQRISNVNIHNFTNEINNEYSTSSICVMTSYYEGFALVLLEALKNGVPCISFDCPFGPASIIIDDYCGFLVENGNLTQFADKLSLLIENEFLRKKFSKSAIIRSKDFSIERIMEQWIKLFNSL